MKKESPLVPLSSRQKQRKTCMSLYISMEKSEKRLKKLHHVMRYSVCLKTFGKLTHKLYGVVYIGRHVLSALDL